MTVHHPSCSLCKGFLAEPVTYVTSCNHPFHTKCWEAAIKTHAAGSKVFCPECTQEIASKEDLKISVKETSLGLIGRMIKYIPYFNFTIVGGVIGVAVENALFGTAISLLSGGFFLGAVAFIPVAYLASKYMEHLFLNANIKGWD